ncbi:MAG: ABC transporter ATP-binding protein [Spirochaetes bacterium]|jgi:putative ABC transport system ATP-binding protein|nr:ABC transporter ATP-binding protein [Spirochaetota bacterium]
MEQNVIELNDVFKEYMLGKTVVRAVNGVSFAIAPGEFTVIAGPSGSGKTTILNMVGCIDDATSGEVLVKGKNHRMMSDNEASFFRNSTIGYVFQNFNLIPVLNTYENIEYPLRIGGKRIDKSVKIKIMNLIEEVGLTDFIKHRPDKLSGGQRQRVAVARALVNNPDIVIADEPTANLDYNTGSEIISIMQRLNELYGTTFVISTHSEMIMKRARRIISIIDGKVQSDIGECDENKNQNYDNIFNESLCSVTGTGC